MDIATIGAKKLKKDGLLPDLDESDEINACSIKLTATVDGKKEDWLVMFKNETHNHPTEIEPFGGAATCLGGAIRDPLSGRTYVYQAMRVTGCADPTAPLSAALKGKLPQRVITKTAAAGFSSYGNQIGLATGGVHELYDAGYAAKRLETGFVVGAVPAGNVYRAKPAAGDVVILLGGETGRDGCGGATGSSKAHTSGSVEECGAEVQKGNALTERKLQRLFRNGNATRLIKKCNDFGAGGVSVAIGELADSLRIDLDKIPKKYKGLSCTELAISESQERMAVVVDKADAAAFIKAAAAENLGAAIVAEVSGSGRLQMTYGGRLAVDISRGFLNTNGVKQYAAVEAEDTVTDYMFRASGEAAGLIQRGDYAGAVLAELSRLNVCSQKGLSELFDSTVGAASVYMPFGGKKQLTPAIAMAAKLPAAGVTEDCTVASFACYPALARENPFAGGAFAVLASAAKLVACGAERRNIRLTLQEYFLRLKDDPRRWGQPFMALLGALAAQNGLLTGAIGGKDSMSGSFEELDVPPTLVSFALAPAKANGLITNVLDEAGVKLYAFKLRYDADNIADFGYARALFDKLSGEIRAGNIGFATVCEEGGILSAVVKSCIGSGIGFGFSDGAELFYPLFGTVIASVKDLSAFSGFDSTYIGVSGGGAFTLKGQKITLAEAEEAYTSRLKGVFPATKQPEGKAENVTYAAAGRVKAAVSVVKPRVFIPVFPGTNGEYDMAAKFKEAGAEPVLCVLKNRSREDIDESVKAAAKRIDGCQIIALPGGFSGGDEPDGSGKFIMAAFRSPRVADAVTALLERRDGLVIGFCNGFQALIKLGLVPYGKIVPQREDSPTLTFNTISRHISQMVDVRVASDKSPWLYGVKPGEVYTVPVSHGEGRFTASGGELKLLIENGQIATQYADPDGAATMESPYNPNGSLCAVEGITSPCGRVLGRMGHSERIGGGLFKNCAGRFDMHIFRSGTQYFK
jgi:phosphoribosylformylglycinamidine synthase